MTAILPFLRPVANDAAGPDALDQNPDEMQPEQLAAALVGYALTDLDHAVTVLALVAPGDLDSPSLAGILGDVQQLLAAGMRPDDFPAAVAELWGHGSGRGLDKLRRLVANRPRTLAGPALFAKALHRARWRKIIQEVSEQLAGEYDEVGDDQLAAMVADGWAKIAGAWQPLNRIHALPGVDRA